MDDTISLTELFGEGEYQETPMSPADFDTMVDELAEGAVSMYIDVGTTQVEITVEHLNPEKMQERVAQGESIFVDIRGAACGLEMYPEPDMADSEEQQ